MRRVASSSGKPELTSKKQGDCFGENTTRGGCDIPRFDVDEYRLVVDGPTMSALHVIDVAAPSKAAPTVTALAGVDGVVLERDGRRAVVVAAAVGAKEVSYEAPRGASTYHVIVGAPESGGKAGVTATSSGAACKVSVKASGGTVVDARPVVVVLDDACAIVEDRTQSKPLAGSGGSGGGVQGAPDAGTDDGPRRVARDAGEGTGGGGTGGDAAGGGQHRAADQRAQRLLRRPGRAGLGGGDDPGGRARPRRAAAPPSSRAMSRAAAIVAAVAVTIAVLVLSSCVGGKRDDVPAGNA